MIALDSKAELGFAGSPCGGPLGQLRALGISILDTATAPPGLMARLTLYDVLGTLCDIKACLFIYSNIYIRAFMSSAKGSYFCTGHFAGIAVGHDSPHILLSSGCLVNTQLWHPSGLHMLQLAKQVENKLKVQRLNCESVTCELTPANFSKPYCGANKMESILCAVKKLRTPNEWNSNEWSADLKISTLTAPTERLNNSQNGHNFLFSVREN